MYKEVGNISASRHRFEWQIDNFFSLLEERYDGCYFSKVFECDDNYWYLEIIPNVAAESQQRLMWVDMRLRRQYHHSSERVSLSIGVCKVDGTEVEVCSRTEVIPQREKVWGTVAFLEKSDLLIRQDEFLDSGSLTIFFYLKSVSLEDPDTSEDEDKVLDKRSCFLLQEDLLEMLAKDDSDSDITIRVGDRDFKAHRSILRARSPVFNGMLAHDMAEKNSGVVTIHDFDPSSFSDFLQFLYTGSVPALTTDNVGPLFRASDKYDLGVLREQCSEFLLDNLDCSTVCDIIRLTSLHGEEAVLKKATEFFADHLAEVLEVESWLDFLKEDPDLANGVFRKGLRRLKKKNAEFLKSVQ